MEIDILVPDWVRMTMPLQQEIPAGFRPEVKVKGDELERNCKESNFALD